MRLFPALRILRECEGSQRVIPEGDSSSVFPLPSLDGGGFRPTSVQMCWENPVAANSRSVGATSTIPSASHPKGIPEIPLDAQRASPSRSSSKVSPPTQRKVRKNPRKLPWKLPLVPEAGDLQLPSFFPLFFIPHRCQGGIFSP